MPFVGARMHRYAVGAKVLAIQRYFHNIRDLSSTCVT